MLTQLIDLLAETLPTEPGTPTRSDGVAKECRTPLGVRPTKPAQLRRVKLAHAKRTGEPFVRNDALLGQYRMEVAEGRRSPNRQLEQMLQLNSVRSSSGIATVTVITEPFPCPGRCVYCPTEARAPKSYLTKEPAVMRAIRSDYDPYRQVLSRLQALYETGHPTEKIELILKGGTWSFYPEAYQEWVIQRCLEAATEFAPGPGLAAQHTSTDRPRASSLEPQTLAQAQQENETARHRVIGVTIETRPDYIDEPEVRRLRALGVTRVELGVQILNDRVLELIVRDHGTQEIRDATKLLRDAGFKVAYHLMPNLPGATPTDDLASFRQLFEDSAYRPDALKIYPCVVVETAELSEWWKDGRYQPYDDETLIELLIQLKSCVPPYVRIERVIRDIPSTSIQAGCRYTNLREEVQRRMASRGVRCACIRCREVREASTESLRLVRRDYDAADGHEVFLSFEDSSSTLLAALLRLRLPSSARNGCAHWWAVLDGAALIRELHTYGPHLPLHDHGDDAVQHRGLGRALVAEAERIAQQEFGCSRIAVIAGVGVREYYRKFGYSLEDTYMVKNLSAETSSRS